MEFFKKAVYAATARVEKASQKEEKTRKSKPRKGHD